MLAIRRAVALPFFVFGVLLGLLGALIAHTGGVIAGDC